MFEFFYEDHVDDDIDEILEYYDSINPRLSANFLERIEEAKKIILSSPKGFEIKYANIRTILLQQFDYHIYYTINAKRIIILAILHANSGEEKINKI